MGQVRVPSGMTNRTRPGDGSHSDAAALMISSTLAVSSAPLSDWRPCNVMLEKVTDTAFQRQSFRIATDSTLSATPQNVISSCV